MFKQINWSKMTWQQKAGFIHYVAVMGFTLGPALRALFEGKPIAAVLIFMLGMWIANLSAGMWISIK